MVLVITPKISKEHCHHTEFGNNDKSFLADRSPEQPVYAYQHLKGYTRYYHYCSIDKRPDIYMNILVQYIELNSYF